MGRHPENPADFFNLELAGFEELRLLRRDADTLKLHAFLEHRYPVGIAAPLVHGVPAVPDPRRVFHHTRMLKDAAGIGSVGKKSRAVFFRGYCHADGVFRHGNRRVADQPIEAKPRNVEHVPIREEIGLPVFFVLVVQNPLICPVDQHLVREERVQGEDGSPAIPDDLGVGVAP